MCRDTRLCSCLLCFTLTTGKFLAHSMETCPAPKDLLCAHVQLWVRAAVSDPRMWDFIMTLQWFSFKCMDRPAMHTAPSWSNWQIKARTTCVVTATKIIGDGDCYRIQMCQKETTFMYVTSITESSGSSFRFGVAARGSSREGLCLGRAPGCCGQCPTMCALCHSTQPSGQWEPGSWIPGPSTAPTGASFPKMVQSAGEDMLVELCSCCHSEGWFVSSSKWSQK